MKHNKEAGVWWVSQRTTSTVKFESETYLFLYIKSSIKKRNSNTKQTCEHKLELSKFVFNTKKLRKT